MNRYQKASSVSNQNRRDKSLEDYYKAPNVCKQCFEIIKVQENQKVSEIRKKSFCGSSCSASFNNSKREKKEKNKKEKNVRPEKFSYLEGVTKKEFFEKKRVYYKFRAIIRKHAQYVYEKHKGEKTCKICGYDKCIQVCHIKSVSSFNDEDLITDINSNNNLIGLCPNHHWEFDHEQITL
jgi:predicted restriction endonuclease